MGDDDIIQVDGGAKRQVDAISDAVQVIDSADGQKNLQEL